MFVDEDRVDSFRPCWHWTLCHGEMMSVVCCFVENRSWWDQGNDEVGGGPHVAVGETTRLPPVVQGHSQRDPLPEDGPQQLLHEIHHTQLVCSTSTLLAVSK